MIYFIHLFSRAPSFTDLYISFGFGSYSSFTIIITLIFLSFLSINRFHKKELASRKFYYHPVCPKVTYIHLFNSIDFHNHFQLILIRCHKYFHEPDLLKSPKNATIKPLKNKIQEHQAEKKAQTSRKPR